MRNIQINYSDIDVNIDLNSGITLLKDISGSGKTFLFTILVSYFQEHDISFTMYDYKNMNNSYNELVAQLENKEFILLDCADLYMTSELWNKLKSLNSYIIVSMKGIDDLNLEGVDICIVKYINDTIRLRRLV